MKETQFRELMECLNGISSRLEAIEDAVSATEAVADYASTLVTVASEQRRIQSAIKDALPITIHDLDDIHKALKDLKLALPSD